MNQESMVYCPNSPYKNLEDNPKGMRKPSEHQIPYDDVFIKTSDKQMLHGWLMLQQSARSCPTIVFLHENAGNLGIRMEFFQLLYRQMGVNILAVAYRGYTKSSGSPSEEGMKLDAQAIYEYISKCDKINKDQIFLLGRSLGGAVAVDLIHHLDNRK
jgi:fermentation-respiration switch protein FrsA (DUF1100 family)